VRHSLIRLLLVALLALGTGALVACGSDDESSSSGGGGGSDTAAKKKIKIAMVTDIGGLNDRGFNSLAYKGLQQAKSDLGADIRVVTSKSNADYVPNLSSLARQDFDLVVAVGFLMGDATAKVAKSFPQTNFAIVDFPSSLLKGKPTNVRGLLFKENEAGYLVGYMAGLYAKKKGGDQAVSAVGGQKVPAVDAYAAGYEAGAKKANPEVTTQFAYSQDFVDQAKCKEIALNQIDKGSQVVFAVAGQCGLGALDAAKEKNVQSIGVDADQGYVNGNVMTSALKKVDVAVFDTAKTLQDGSFKGGEDTVFDVKSGAVGLGKVNAAGQPFEADVKKIQDQISAGEITDIPNEVGK
jgi:basic membrane protein A and related proteins